MLLCPACKATYPEGERFCLHDGAALVPDTPQDNRIGALFGNYQIVEKLGEGGMGTVYKAVHPSLERSAAVKILHPEYARDPDVLCRFFDEARAVNKIRHRHILDVFDLGRTQDGTAYLIAELLEGEDLERVLRRKRRLFPAEVQKIFTEVCEALEAAHEKGIIHRDLKPENIFLCRQDGRDDFVKLVDFGIAKLLDAGEAGGRTKTGLVMGTPHYMSPEQAASDKKLDARSDLYSLGVILYECLTGTRPFRAESVTGIVMQHILEKPPPLRSALPEGKLPSALEALVMRLLEKDPERRYRSAAVLKEALRDLAILGGAGVATPTELPSTAEATPSLSPLAAPHITPTTAPRLSPPEATRSAAPKSSAAVDPPLTRPRSDDSGKKKRLLAALLALPVALGAILWMLSLASPKAPSPAASPSAAPPLVDKPLFSKESEQPKRDSLENEQEYPKECAALFDSVCSCRPLEENCKELRRQIDEADAALTAKSIKRKEIDRALKDACKKAQRKVDELRETLGCREEE